jgi:hypothetical protein
MPAECLDAVDQPDQTRPIANDGAEDGNAQTPDPSLEGGVVYRRDSGRAQEAGTLHN